MDKRVAAFLHHELTTEEIRLLEADLRADPSLAEELAFFLYVKKTFRDKAKQQKLEKRHDEWQQKRRRSITRPLWGRIAAAAAVLIVVAGLGWIVMMNEKADLRGYSAQYVADSFSSISVHMGETIEHDSLQLAINAYNNGDPKTAQLLTRQILSHSPHNWEAMRVGGIAALKLREYDSAILLFRTLGDETSLFGNPGRFYEAIARIEEGSEENLTLAKGLLREVAEQGLEGAKKAEKWLELIE